MYERPRESWARFNFYVYAWPSIHCLYFIYARKNYVTLEINLKSLSQLRACLHGGEEPQVGEVIRFGG